MRCKESRKRLAPQTAFWAEQPIPRSKMELQGRCCRNLGRSAGCPRDPLKKVSQQIGNPLFPRRVLCVTCGLRSSPSNTQQDSAANIAGFYATKAHTSRRRFYFPVWKLRHLLLADSVFVHMFCFVLFFVLTKTRSTNFPGLIIKLLSQWLVLYKTYLRKVKRSGSSWGELVHPACFIPACLDLPVTPFLAYLDPWARVIIKTLAFSPSPVTSKESFSLGQRAEIKGTSSPFFGSLGA